MTAAPVSQQRFHAHLDKCQRCREHPFDLCVIGGELLRSAALDAPTNLDTPRAKEKR